MTIKQRKLLKGYLQKCASEYNSPSVLTLENPIYEAFEEYEAEDNATLGVILGNVILRNHTIGLQGHQEKPFYDFWVKVVEEAKA